MELDAQFVCAGVNGWG